MIMTVAIANALPCTMRFTPASARLYGSNGNVNSNSRGRSKLNPEEPAESNEEQKGRRMFHKHGSSRKSKLRKSFMQEQVEFTTRISEDPHVAILGGGMSGLLCALTLEERGIRSTVFDTGNHGLGGRMGTRQIDPNPLVFDHGAQFFTVSNPEFKKLVDGWISKGVVKEWKAQIYKLCRGGQHNPMPPAIRYIGTDGMRPLAESMLSQSHLINLVRPCWISRLEPINGMWHLAENKKPRGQFDTIVIAHNGKCANRLLSSAGLPLIRKQMKRLELSSIWALLAAFDEPLPLPKGFDDIPFEGAFVEGIHALSWMANNTKKLFPSQNHGPYCWTFFSTASYGKKNKTPQENIPKIKAERVKEEMLQGVEIALGLQKGSLQRPFYSRLQLWGAALPTNTPGIPCIFDPYGRAGICGDWLLGSSLEAAALSGRALAHHIADYYASGGSDPDAFSVGLHQEFTDIVGHDIGQFPGIELLQTQDSAALEPSFI